MHTLLTIHLLSAVIWVGGMFFAYVCLRPVAASLLAPPQRLSLWADVFQRFFKWVWLAIAALILSGHGMIAMYGGFAQIGLHIHIMLGLGYLMIALYAFLFFLRYKQLRVAVAEENWQAAGGFLNKIRHIVAVNLILGLITIAVASGGKYLF
ncbi:MAG: CopD family protein [Neptuniibacter sp.]